MVEEFMTPDETDRYIDDRIRRTTGRRKGGVLGNLLFILVCLIPIALLVARIGPEVAVMYGVRMPMLATAAVTFSTAAAPLPTAQAQQRHESPALPVVGAAPWPTLTPTQAPVDVPAPTPAAHLVLSRPEDNPGFDSQVEPGNEPTPVVGLVDPEDAPVDLYGVEDRVFAPAALPTSNTKDNPGFDSGVEPGNEPTPAQ